MSQRPNNASNPGSPWWRHGMVWLVISGPAIVVVAGFATLALAILNPDPVIVQGPVSDPAHVPAVQGRNHAATGGVR